MNISIDRLKPVINYVSVFIVSLIAILIVLGIAGRNPHNGSEWATVTRSINSSAFTPNSDKVTEVYYTISIQCTATIGSAAIGSVTLQESPDGSTWNDVASVKSSNTIVLN